MATTTGSGTEADPYVTTWVSSGDTIKVVSWYENGSSDTNEAHRAAVAERMKTNPEDE